MKRLDIDILGSFLGVYRSSCLSMKKYQILKGGRASLKTTRHGTRIVIDSIMIPKMVSYVVGLDASKLETGLCAEFLKIIERVTGGVYVEGRTGNYWFRKKPLSIIFNNGSEIHFVGSKNAHSLKGRSVPSSKHRFGYVFFDEFGDYDERDGIELFKQLAPTFLRNDFKGDATHYFWRTDQLSLDKVVYDEDGNVVLEEDMYGELQPKIISGTDTLGVKFLFSWNPPENKYSWINDFVEDYSKRPDTMVKHINYTDIKRELISIGQLAIISEAETTKQYDYTKYLHVWLGQSVSTSGLFFKSFDPFKWRVPRSTLKHTTGKQWAIGVDYGVANATTFIAICKVGNERVIGKLYKHSNRDVHDAEHEKGSSEYSRDLLQFVENLQREYKLDYKQGFPVIIDPSAKGYMIDIRQLLRDKKSRLLRVGKAYNKREDTLSHVQDLINQGLLKCVEKIEFINDIEDELMTAQVVDGKNDIVKDNDHFIDALRYVTWKILKGLIK